MAAMKSHQSFQGQLAQPGIEGQRPVPKVAVQFAVGFGKNILDDVGWIHARCQAAIEPAGDHVAQPLPVPRQQSAPGGDIPRHGLLYEVLGIGLGCCHDSSPEIDPANLPKRLHLP
jgi:hypothetical protein